MPNQSGIPETNAWHHSFWGVPVCALRPPRIPPHRPRGRRHPSSPQRSPNNPHGYQTPPLNKSMLFDPLLKFKLLGPHKTPLVTLRDTKPPLCALTTFGIPLGHPRSAPSLQRASRDMFGPPAREPPRFPQRPPKGFQRKPGGVSKKSSASP